MKKTRLACLLVFALLILMPSRPFVRAEDDPDKYSIEEAGPVAENLTGLCKITSNMRTTAYTWRLTDESLNTNQILKKGQTVSLSWPDEVPVKTVWLAFKDYPKAYHVQQFDANGTLIQEEEGQKYINHAVFVAEETRTVTVVSDSDVTLCSFYAYGEGVVPSYHPWKPTPEKMDYLIVVTHPDDDVLFMGAILPLYTVEAGREGSVYYAAAGDRVRRDEAGDGAWVMGLRTAPLLDDFMDIPTQFREKYENKFSDKAVTRAMVRLFRRYRPEVVFSHDLKGEYGHWQHVVLANAVKEATILAAKKYYDPASLKLYGTWQVKKTYLHLYRKNKISLPIDKPIAAYGGLTPKEIAAAALLRHGSQLSLPHTKAEGEKYSLSDFGLFYTAVGLDTPGLNDPFEHIDPDDLHFDPAPTPTPGPTPLPSASLEPANTPVSVATPEPTMVPEPTDMPTPPATPMLSTVPPVSSKTFTASASAAAPVEKRTAVPAASWASAAPSIQETTGSPLFWLLPLLVGVAAVLCIGIYLLSRKR
jgi:LmbE family N-acetylglucosaminyl deacetylase